MSPVTERSGSARDERSIFLILLGLSFVVLLPILRANRYYNDDLSRALIGRQGWDATGRPLTNLLMRALQCYDHAMVDISPLTQLAAIAILSWVGVLAARRFAISSPWLAALVVFPLGAQPFFLENLSYKFDSLSMTLALGLALLPIVSLKSDRRGWWLGVLVIFASLNFYQAAVNAYLLFILLELVLAQLRDETPRELFIRFCYRLLQAGASMLVYQLVVGIHVNGWVKQKSEKIHTLEQLPLVKANIVDYFNYIGGSFDVHWWMYFGPVMLVLGLLPVVIGIRYALRVRLTQPVWVSAILFATALLMPVVALACVLGPMLFLVSPPIAARELTGVGALLAAGLIIMQAALRQWHQSDAWTLSVAGMLAVGMCTIASAYGNALGVQKEYENRIAAGLADDLAEIRAAGPMRAILLEGAAGYAPVTAHVAGQFPIIHDLVPPYIDADDLFLTPIFLMHYLPDFVNLHPRTDPQTSQLAAATLAKTCHLTAIRNTSAYSLYLIDNIAVVTFGSALAQRCGAPAGTGDGAQLASARHTVFIWNDLDKAGDRR
ncbi:MAG TPA: glucosyltransferase domain-containing protein [Rudaea sp.]|jgi:hypothetical protein